MWPQTLQMTRDECRGILRRLELESYSQVISVFRAQGGLSDAKAKVLEELRIIFHISQERHRAEARRVANDEQLATIAEAISGPNTWQEWSREGRRPYPLLPRVAPQTALALIANSVAEATASENAKLPYPTETSIQSITGDEIHSKIKHNCVDTDRKNYVITSDPFKVPEIPLLHRKNFKRNNEQQVSGGGAKKRIFNENSPQAPYIKYHHITANSTTANSVSITSKNHATPRKSNVNQQSSKKLQQQRFHQQQQIQKQKSKKPMTAIAKNDNISALGNGSVGKRQATPAKSGRRAQKVLQQQQRQHQQLLTKQQQEQPETQQHKYDVQNAPITKVPLQTDIISQKQQKISSPSIVDINQFNPYTPQPHPPQQIFMDSKEGSSIETVTTTQNAATKRDVTKNLSKIQIQKQHVNEISTALSNALPTTKMERSLISATPVQKYVEELQTSLATMTNTTTTVKTVPTNTQVNNSAQHILQVSGTMSGTPEQILALPQFSAAATKLRAVNTTIIAPGTKLSSNTLGVVGVSKKFTPLSPIGAQSSSSSFNTTAPVVTPASTAALHELANVASSQTTQLFNIIDSTGAQVNSAPMSLHTPPAIIQIHNANSTTVAGGSGVSDTQCKVLSTKLLPIVLSGNNTTITSTIKDSNSNSNSNSNTNNTSIMAGLTNTSSVNALTGSSSSGASSTMIKSFPSTLVLNNNTNNLTACINISDNHNNNNNNNVNNTNNNVNNTNNNNNTLISTLNAGTTVFRKSSTNLSKASTNPSRIVNSKSSGPHIISNVKLTPVSVSTIGGANTIFTNNNVGTTTTTTTTCSNLKGVMMPSTTNVMRTTNVKICQSPNGKVFIQSTGSSGVCGGNSGSNILEANKIKLNSTSLQQHKLLSGGIANAASCISGTATLSSSGNQRIAIQKVQIIPAPLNCNTSSLGTTLSSVKSSNINSPTIKNNNMIIVPVSASGSNVRPVTLSKSSNNLLIKTAAQQQQQPNVTDIQKQTTHTKNNIVILSNTANIKEKMACMSSTPAISTSKYHNNQFLINNKEDEEDAPLDILNMPIVMDSGVSINDGSGHSSTDTVTILSSGCDNGNSIAEKQNCNTGIAKPLIVERIPHSTHHQMLLNATDWELELDHAITTGAIINNSNNNNNNNKVIQNVKTFNINKQRCTIVSSTTIPNTTTISTVYQSSNGGNQEQKCSAVDSFHVSDDGSNNFGTNVISHPANVTPITSNIIVEDSFDDVIVEEREDDDNDANNSNNADKDDTNNNNNNVNTKLQELRERSQQDISRGILDKSNIKTLIVDKDNKKAQKSYALPTDCKMALLTTTAKIIKPATKTTTLTSSSKNKRIHSVLITSSANDEQQQQRQQSEVTIGEVNRRFDETIEEATDSQDTIYRFLHNSSLIHAFK